MKKVLLGVFIVASSALFAQNVPANVSSAFSAKFPNAEDAEWDQYNSNYEVSFYDGETAKTALFTKDGKYKECRTSIDEAPAAVIKAVEAKCNGALIDGITLVEMADGTAKYEITASSEDASYNVVADTSGKILSSEKVADDYEDEDE